MKRILILSLYFLFSITFIFARSTVNFLDIASAIHIDSDDLDVTSYLLGVSFQLLSVPQDIGFY